MTKAKLLEDLNDLYDLNTHGATERTTPPPFVVSGDDGFNVQFNHHDLDPNPTLPSGAVNLNSAQAVNSLLSHALLSERGSRLREDGTLRLRYRLTAEEEFLLTSPDLLVAAAIQNTPSGTIEQRTRILHQRAQIARQHPQRWRAMAILRPLLMHHSNTTDCVIKTRDGLRDVCDATDLPF